MHCQRVSHLLLVTYITQFPTQHARDSPPTISSLDEYRSVSFGTWGGHREESHLVLRTKTSQSITFLLCLIVSRRKGKRGRQTDIPYSQALSKHSWGTGVCTVLVRRGGGSLSVTALGSHQLSGVDLHLERRKPRLGEVWSLVQRHPGSDW